MPILTSHGDEKDSSLPRFAKASRPRLCEVKQNLGTERRGRVSPAYICLTVLPRHAINNSQSSRETRPHGLQTVGDVVIGLCVFYFEHMA